MPLVLESTLQPGAEEAAPQDDPNASWWQRTWSKTLHGLGALVEVRKLDNSDAMLLAPEQAYFVRENLRLRLIDARTALMQHNGEVYLSDLNAAEAAVRRYFDTNSPATQAWLKELAELKSLDMRLVSNDALKASLAAVRQYQDTVRGTQAVPLPEAKPAAPAENAASSPAPAPASAPAVRPSENEASAPAAQTAPAAGQAASAPAKTPEPEKAKADEAKAKTRRKRQARRTQSLRTGQNERRCGMKALLWILILFAAAVGLSVASTMFSGNVYFQIGATLARVDLKLFVPALILAVVLCYILVQFLGGLAGIPARLQRFGTIPQRAQSRHRPQRRRSGLF